MVDSILSVFKNVSKSNIINTALANGIAAGDVASVQKLIEENTVCLMIEDHLDQNHNFHQVSFNLALLACIRQDKADVLEALLPQVQHIDNVISLIVIVITISIMPTILQ